MSMPKMPQILDFKLLTLAALALLALSSCDLMMSDEVIAQNENYTVTADSVVTPHFVAHAPNDFTIKTNYHTQAITSIPNVLKFRLSLGARDVELLPAQYHYIDLKNASDTLKVKAFEADSAKLSSTQEVAIPQSLHLKIDMSKAASELRERGYYVTPSLDTLYRTDIEQATTELLIEVEKPALEFKARIDDPWLDDNSCVVSVDLRSVLEHQSLNYNSWQLTNPNELEGLPRYNSNQHIVNAVYNMSLQQVLSGGDNQFSSLIAGDCYAIALSLAYIQPRQSMERLKQMVDDGIINTERGNRSYASLTNDLMWAQAAWSVYCSTGDKEWLKYCEQVILASLDKINDLNTSSMSSLWHAMCPYISSYTSQYYPKWMSPSDAYETIPLVGNIIMEHTYRLLGQIADEFEKQPLHDTQADRIKNAINHRLWNEQNERYTQYLYGGVTPVMSPLVDNLGQAMSVLWDIADDDRAEQLIKETPVTNYGVPLIYPNREGTGTGLNNSVIPMVQSIWNLAAAKTSNMSMLRHGMGALVYQQAMAASCATTCDATTGAVLPGNNPRGNAAGNIAMVLRVIAGMNFLPGGIELNPRVPSCFAGVKTISNYHYRNAIFTITIKGYGNDWSKITLDGKELDYNFIDGSLKGEHKIVITMNGENAGSGKITQAHSPATLPAEPQWKWNGLYGTNYTYSNALGYKILINGEPTYSMRDSVLGTRDSLTYRNYSIVAINKYGQGFMASPHYIMLSAKRYNIGNTLPASGMMIEFPKSFKHSLVELRDDSTWLSTTVTTANGGDYVLDLLYSNGNENPSFWSPCDMIQIWANGHNQGVVVVPPQGMNQWCSLNYSSHLQVKLLKGSNTIKMRRIRPSAAIGEDIIYLSQLRLVKVE